MPKLAVRVGWGGLVVGQGLCISMGSCRETQDMVVVLLTTYSRASLVEAGDGVGVGDWARLAAPVQQGVGT